MKEPLKKMSSKDKAFSLPLRADTMELSTMDYSTDMDSSTGKMAVSTEDTMKEE